MSEARIPVIKLYNQLIVSIQVALSDELVRRLTDDITNKIVATGVQGLIIDLSGVDIMDSYLTRALHDVALMATLLGARTVLCGIEPTIAMTLVEMDLDLPGIVTRLNLESAIAHLQEQEKLAHEGDDLLGVLPSSPETVQ